MTRSTGATRLDRALMPIPAPVLFIVSGITLYSGAALAVGVFQVVPPHTVAWLRAVISAVVLTALVRPWRVVWTWRTVRESSLFGIVLVGMNMLFYVSINYLPLGAAVAIEFAGPALVAARGNRTTRGLLGAGLAAAGVACISLVGLRWDDVDGAAMAIGIVCAIAAGVTWAVYMVLGGRIAAVRDGQASLALGSVAAAVVLAPLALPWAGPMLSASGSVWVAVVGVGVLSSVIPYVLDQVAIKRIGTAAFALLNALLPATATVVGLVMLRQQPTVGEVVGLVAISVAIALTRRRKANPAPE